MTTIKDALCLLSIFIAYGVTGRLDYEDAVQLEQIRQDRRNADCLQTFPSEDREALTIIDGHSVDSPYRRPDEASSEDGNACVPRLLWGNHHAKS